MKNIEFINMGRENIKFNLVFNNQEFSKDNFRNYLEEGIIWDDEIGYAGYKTKEAAVNTILSFIFGKNEIMTDIRLDIKKVSDIISGSIKSCNKFVEIEDLNIFVFPTVSNFTLKNLNGVCGLTPWKKTILFFINPIEKWEEELKETSCHEYAHIITHRFHNWKTLLDSLIFEGIAEHFREQVVGGDIAAWANALNEKELIPIMKKLIPLLESEDFNLYSNVFYGNNEFKQWSGYSLGYYIVKLFMLNNEINNWNEIFKLPAKEVLDKSKFIEKC